MQGGGYADDGLEDFFAAGRRHAPPPPSAALMTRILADAAETGAARTTAPRRLARLGSWPAAAALGFCAVIGLSAGLLGGAERGSEALWEAAGTADEPATEILAFYDLASLED
jgi:hypothetical protein